MLEETMLWYVLLQISQVAMVKQMQVLDMVKQMQVLEVFMPLLLQMS